MTLIMAMFGFVIVSVFMGSVDSDVGLNEYTVYRKNSMSNLVNFKIKEDVKGLTNSTEGLQTTPTPGTGSSTNSPSATTGTSRVEELWGYAQKYAAVNGVDPILVACVLAQESGWGSNLEVSSAGAQGPMQIISKHVIPDVKSFKLWTSEMTTDLDNFENNVMIGTAYLKICEKVIGLSTPEDIGAGYNIGPYGYNKNGKKPAGWENRGYYYSVQHGYKNYVTGVKKLGEWDRYNGDGVVAFHESN